ncbi:hypothetical protein GF420_06100 [candidate division GN15 bacterium]|nr:hypothetical protein [candidate division GN15 bacterium]
MDSIVNKLLIAAAVVIGVFSMTVADLAEAELRLTGRVTDSEQRPIVGASVTLLADDKPVTGAATDSLGRFSFPAMIDAAVETRLRVSSVGYSEYEHILTGVRDSLDLQLELRPTSVALGSVAVYPKPEINLPHARMDAETIVSRSRQSLVPTNPVGAIRTAEIDRVGSSHSSRLRIYGDSPVYYLNGTPIGRDPDHYGMFHILPASTLDRLRVSTQGTDPSRAGSSAIEMATSVRFERHREFDFNLSTIEATGTASIGNDHLFARAAVRKSVLDKLVRQFDIHTDRRTIPPTNFQDISVYAGWKVSPNVELFVDQYYVRDYLSYLVDSYVASGQVSTYQHSSRQFVAVRGRGTFDRLSITGGLSLQSLYEEYRARPVGSEDNRRLLIELAGDRTAVIGTMRGDYIWKDYRFMAGIETEDIVSRTIDLRQRNWNFLSPFASSNSPYIYQRELNDLYGSYARDDSEHNRAVYGSAERMIGDYTVEFGLRGQYYDRLADRSLLLYRLNASGPVHDDIYGRLSLGSYAENPARNILEPYQVIVSDHLGALAPIRSDMLTLSLEYRGLAVSLFGRREANRPILTHDFSSRSDSTGLPTDGFVGVTSDGYALYRGLAIAWSDNGSLHERLSLDASYAFTRATKSEHGLEMPADLDAPHRLRVQSTYRVTPGVEFGAELAVRSGYPYTPTAAGTPTAMTDRYTRAYYLEATAAENSERFRASASLNLFGEVSVGEGIFYFSIGNVTNRANPIINTSSGEINDAGIMPTIGYRVLF